MPNAIDDTAEAPSVFPGHAAALRYTKSHSFKASFQLRQIYFGVVDVALVLQK